MIIVINIMIVINHQYLCQDNYLQLNCCGTESIDDWKSVGWIDNCRFFMMKINFIDVSKKYEGFNLIFGKEYHIANCWLSMVKIKLNEQFDLAFEDKKIL